MLLAERRFANTLSWQLKELVDNLYESDLTCFCTVCLYPTDRQFNGEHSCLLKGVI